MEINTIYRGGKKRKYLDQTFTKKESLLMPWLYAGYTMGKNGMNGCIDVRRDERRGQTDERTGDAHST